MRTLLTCLLLLTLALAGASSAVAQPTDKETAIKLYELSQDAFKQGQFDLAVDYLERAYDLDPHPIILYNLARSYEGLGEIDKAEEALGRVKTDPMSDEDLLRKTDVALTRVLNLKKNQVKLGQLSIVTLPTGATVFLDDKEVGSTPYNAEHPEGLHMVRIEMEGFPTHEETVTLSPNAKTSIEIQLGGQTTGPPPEPGLNGLTVSGIVLLSIGGAATILGAGVYFPAKNAEETMTRMINKQRNNPAEFDEGDVDTFNDAKNRGKALSTVSVISYGIGFVGIGVGAGLLIWGLMDDGGDVEADDTAERNPLIPSNAAIDPVNGSVMFEWTF